jgi:hypothetical protein
MHVKRTKTSGVTALSLLFLAWVGTGCGGFNANVPISPLWFIHQPPPRPVPPVASPGPTEPAQPPVS